MMFMQVRVDVSGPTPPDIPVPPGAPTAPVVAGGTNGNVTFTVVGADGRKEIITVPRSVANAITEVPRAVSVRRSSDMGPGIAIGAMFAIIMITLFQRFRGGQKVAASSQLQSDSAARLDRMERGIEAIAIEVERISEGQRFVTKLMSEQKEPERARLGGQP